MNLFKDKQPLQQTEPPQPVRQTLPVQQPLMSQRRSEQAAAAAQHLFEVETALEQAHQDLRTAQNDVVLVEQRLQDMERQVSILTEERDWHKARHVQIETSLRNSAAIILDVLRTPMADAPHTVVEANQENEDRIKRAVGDLEADIGRLVPRKPDEPSR